jgi:hypothetical protein
MYYMSMGGKKEMNFVIPIVIGCLCVWAGHYIRKTVNDNDISFTCGFLVGVGVVCCMVVLVSELWRV